MEKQIVQLSEIEFDEKFTLIRNHLDKNASFDGNMFETYSPEIDFVLEMAKQNRVITILEGEDGEMHSTLYYVSGYHLVNRLGFFVVDKPLEEEFNIKLEW